jgi:hypothetical protein
MAMTQQSGDPISVPGDPIQDRLHFFDPRPPAEFDPLLATPEELKRYGIPPKPDPAQRPALYRFWQEMFSRQLVWVVPTSLSIPTGQLSGTATEQPDLGDNWSGASITPRDGQQFTEVHAAWTVPHIAAPAGSTGSPDYRSSIWIGLDGRQRNFDSSLPQFGTAHFLNGPPNVLSFHTWCQWWLRDNPHTYAGAILNVTVAPDDKIVASLYVLNETQVHCVIKNQTTGEILPFTMDSPTDEVSGRRPAISGATAEWIVERFADRHTGQLYELPDYGSVPFTNCLARSEKSPFGVPAPGQERNLEGATLITMYKVERDPSRKVAISEPKRPHGPNVDQFETSYVK